MQKRMQSSLLFVLSLSIFTTSHVCAEATEPPIRMGIISLATPAKIYKQWTPYADYLAAKLGRDVEIVVPRGFKKIIAAVENNDVDLFYVNSHIFYRLMQQGKALPVAQMQNLKGSITSNSVIFVRSDSGIDSIQDLKGEKLAFVSPMGAGGYLAPRAQFYKEGIKTRTDTEEKFTKNLSSSLHKVLLGDVKAGTMCGLNYQLMSQRIETGDLKIISTSSDYPENVMGAHPDMPKELREQIIDVVIDMDSDSQGKKVLSDMQSMKILKFVAYDTKTERITKILLDDGEF